MNLAIFKKPKTLFLIISFFIIVFTILLIDSAKVSADVLPVVVNVNHLDFGTVFPGEEREGNFIVSYTEGQEEDVLYRIVQKRKPLPEEHPEYPDGGDPKMPGYYMNLCPFLEKISVEQEGDTENQASVGWGDLSDTWIVYFKVPAIVGYVAQEHIGGVVSSNGEYGCDISIDILGCIPGETRLCDIDQLGICAEGTETCIDGSWDSCVQDNQPADEICNNDLDDNCDGYTDCLDEGCFHDDYCLR